jgi:hypothetical protein
MVADTVHIKEKIQMKTELTYEKPVVASALPIIVVDDLKYDGKNLVIPSYWTDTIEYFLRQINVESIEVDERPDFNTLKEFIIRVQDKKQEYGN